MTSTMCRLLESVLGGFQFCLNRRNTHLVKRNERLGELREWGPPPGAGQPLEPGSGPPVPGGDSHRQTCGPRQPHQL